MTALNKYFLSPQDKQFLIHFIGILQKCGNRQRALSHLCSLLSKIKEGIAGSSAFNKYPLSTLDEKSPIQILNKSLYNLKPAFLLRRVYRSGRRYDLPVPISDKRSTFMAIDWLRKSVFKNNKNEQAFPTLLAYEISALLYQEGSAKNFLKAYIDIALDQRPFERFIKRRRFVTAKSKRKGTGIARIYKSINKSIRRHRRLRKYRATKIIRRTNIRIIRNDLKKKLKRSKLKIRAYIHKKKARKQRYARRGQFRIRTRL